MVCFAQDVTCATNEGNKSEREKEETKKKHQEYFKSKQATNTNNRKRTESSSFELGFSLRNTRKDAKTSERGIRPKKAKQSNQQNELTQAHVNKRVCSGGFSSLAD